MLVRLLNVKEVLFRVTPVTGILTVTVHVAFLLESSTEVTVIVAVPEPLGVTTPAFETVATLELELDHVTFLLVALDGKTVAVRV